MRAPNEPIIGRDGVGRNETHLGYDRNLAAVIASLHDVRAGVPKPQRGTATARP